MDLDQIADHLYSLVPAEFIGERDAAVARARDSGDSELADTIKRLRKPTVGAAALNALARDRSAALSEFLAFGPKLVTAQSAGAGDTVRELMRDRKQQLSELVIATDALALEHGMGSSAAIQREVQTALLTALSDRTVEAAIRGGRLATAPDYAGLGDTPPPTSPPAAAGRRTRPKPEDAAKETARKRREAEQVAKTAALAAAKAAEEVAEAEASAASLRRQVDELKAELERVSGEASLAERVASRARREHAKAVKQVDRTRES